jgi:hypothetical protein
MTHTRHDGHPVVLIENPRYFERLHYKLARRDRLPIWTVYDRTTREYPGKYVARMWVTLPEAKPTRFTITHDTLAELRAILPSGLYLIQRRPEDLPEIVETWL